MVQYVVAWNLSTSLSCDIRCTNSQKWPHLPVMATAQINLLWNLLNCHLQNEWFIFLQQLAIQYFSNQVNLIDSWLKEEESHMSPERYERFIKNFPTWKVSREEIRIYFTKVPAKAIAWQGSIKYPFSVFTLLLYKAMHTKGNSN